MKLLPHYFKLIGLILFFLGFLLAIDDFRLGFIEGSAGTTMESFDRLLPEIFGFWGDFVTLSGLFIYILSKNRTEDEFTRKLRYESAFLVMVLTILIVLVVYVVNHNYLVKPSILLALQMFAYLIIRLVKRKIILGEGYEE
ncbi:MAG: hypothetical protein R3182_02575 [Draconibacterium sp.]|nr:hypothetical protein [Draconibacterium sp.]